MPHQQHLLTTLHNLDTGCTDRSRPTQRVRLTIGVLEDMHRLRSHTTPADHTGTTPALHRHIPGDFTVFSQPILSAAPIPNTPLFSCEILAPHKSVSCEDNSYFIGCLGGAVVRTRDRKVAGSTPGRGAIKSTRSTQPYIPPGYR